ncbi:cell division protein SepF [Micromonospora sp. NPDC047762]|uniref:cell division protein SepF n=1 Tax=Micromonospora sp. NPDC047762 TaxID=3364255 RepID=UPI00371E13DE
MDLSGEGTRQALLSIVDAEGTLASDEARLSRGEAAYDLLAGPTKAWASPPKKRSAKPELSPIPLDNIELPPGGSLVAVQLRDYGDIEEATRHFRNGTLVVIDLRACDIDDARRSVDFAAGLALGLRGSMMPVVPGVFLLVPHGLSVQVRKQSGPEASGFNKGTA